MSTLVRLGPLLGHVTPDAARVFIRLRPEAPMPLVATCREIVGGRRVDGAGVSVPIPAWPGGSQTFAGDVPLPGGPGVLHEITLASGGEDVGSVLARAAEPASSEGRIAFAFGSCWKVDAVGRPEATWEMVAALARQRVVDHLLLLGDQIYADLTPLPSRPGETATSAVKALGPGAPLAERQALYGDAYQRAWDVPALQRALAMLPVASTWDDHEITDGFGSSTSHVEPEWRGVFEAASAACAEWQGSRNPPALGSSSKAWAFRRGPAAFVGLDLRTHRSHPEQRLLGDEQKRAVRDWLEGPGRSAPVLVVACSVPPMHLPKSISALHGISDVRDQWPMTCEADRRWLLQRLRDFEEGGRRRVLVLGGDAHMATAISLRDRSGRALWQVTSSPLAQRLPTFVYPALTLLGRRFTVETESGESLAAHVRHRWRGPNVGVVQGSVADGRIDLSFELQRPGRRAVSVDLRARLD